MRNRMLAVTAIFILLVSTLMANSGSVPMLFYGEASWYGQKFNGRRTASGEIFDMNKMTAAHRTLPFGTLIEVTNLENDRKVTVTINDRGPYAKGRVLDLSKAAATSLKFIRQGSAKVEVRVLKLGKPGMQKRSRKKWVTEPDGTGEADLRDFPSLDKKNRNPSPRGMDKDISAPDRNDERDEQDAVREGRFVVQVGAFAEKSNAEELVAKMKKEGYSAYIFQKSGGRFFRVFVNGFKTRSAAESAKERLQDSCPGAFVRSAKQ